MLEVNDFNAVRISLASPEQIRSWSYGEVVKPETINYRTLKPEKDGLFCEKIFGPTKDFECYCGKYKRVRFKGVICDKCGVEVTRSKVRRERMGHIDLVSPVSHIWFVKGTPSRLGLLLDISPRSLERILYFAQYIVTAVDKNVRAQLLDDFTAEIESRTQDLQAAQKQEVAEKEAVRDERVAELKEAMAAAVAEIDARQARELQEAEAEYQIVHERLSELLHQAAPEDISYGQEIIAKHDEAVNEERLAALDEAHNVRKADINRRQAEDTERAQAIPSAEIELAQTQCRTDTEQINARYSSQIADSTKDLSDQRVEIEDLKPQQLLAENKFRELRDRYPDLFRAGMGAEAVREIVGQLEIDELREDLRQEINSSSGQRRKKATKRLRVVEAFRKSGNRPEWMIFTVLPVLPPDLRPMVQLDGGRFATSDLNDLYRRVINRNNRLRRLLELGAPEIIIRNEKRMLQEAVDSLIDNGRRGRAVSGSSNHKLKSLSDMLKGKQGRFRQNLLGKRVDYSGRSVIVVGSDLKLHQCGLPKRMAIELFKPFIMRKLVERGYAHNIKSAKRIVERVRPEVWDVLEEVIADRPVLLNRAPTLHRLSIQAFQPVLIDGSAIQIHPLVCSAFNADFDGDQMAVHVPLSWAAVEEAKQLMLSTKNLLSPSSGEPTVAPTLDMVLGCYYLTVARPGAKGEGKTFYDFDEAKLAYELRQIDLQAEILVRTREYPDQPNGMLKTTVGRVIFNDILPTRLRYRNEIMDKKALRKVVADCYRLLGNEETAAVVDDIKNLGFEFATRSGITIAVTDIESPPTKRALLAGADQEIAESEKQYRRGLITDEERYKHAVEIWTDVTQKISDDIEHAMDRFGSIYMMSSSGAKGNISQIRQMAGMRGLMTDPSGRIIELPIRSSFREGLTVLEYFISTHGARKGLADTALRTADSGYLTRRLIDVAQDIIVLEEDCGTDEGITLPGTRGKSAVENLGERVIGRLAARDSADPETGEIIFPAGEEFTEDNAHLVGEHKIEQVMVRSPLSCTARHGICQACYGRSLATGRTVELGEAVGIVAAQSIGEPGTQLTMRTFHTGGVAGVVDITTGLPRVEELFEARVPKGQSIITEIDGVVEVMHSEEAHRIKVLNTDIYRDEYPIPEGYRLLVKTGDIAEFNQPLALPPAVEGEPEESKLPANTVVARLSGEVRIEDGKVVLLYEEKEERDYLIPANARVNVETGDRVKAGDQLTEGSINPQDILRVMGREAVQLYLVEEVQKTYRSQGVTINDKHIETIVRNMLRKVRVDTPGDTTLLPGELIDHFVYEETNAKVLAEGGEPATAQTVLLGITKASLNTESFLAAASFQETTRVLTEAAINGSIDRLVGLKENVIIGKLIPAGTGAKARKQELLAALQQAHPQVLPPPPAMALRFEDEVDGHGPEDGPDDLAADEDDGLRASLAAVNLGEADDEQ